MEQQTPPFPSSSPFVVKDHSFSQEDFELYWDATRLSAKTLLPANTDPLAYYPQDDYISHQEQPTGLTGGLYRMAQRFMMSYKYNKLLPLLPKQAQLLDYGCGVGSFARYLTHQGHRVYGVEPNTKARQFAMDKGIQAFASLEALHPKSFDAILLWHVLEHLPEPEKALQEFYQRLAPEGHLVLAVPNLRSADAQHYGAHWAAYDVPRHLWHFSQGGIAQLAAQTGFRVRATYPMPLDAFYISLLSEHYKGSRLSAVKGFFQGLRSNVKALFTGEFSSLFYVLEKC